MYQSGYNYGNYGGYYGGGYYVRPAQVYNPAWEFRKYRRLCWFPLVILLCLVFQGLSLNVIESLLMCVLLPLGPMFAMRPKVGLVGLVLVMGVMVWAIIHNFLNFAANAKKVPLIFGITNGVTGWGFSTMFVIFNVFGILTALVVIGAAVYCVLEIKEFPHGRDLEFATVHDFLQHKTGGLLTQPGTTVNITTPAATPSAIHTTTIINTTEAQPTPTKLTS